VDKFVIDGPTPLAGTVRVEGAKNAVLPLMAAALLSRGKSVISNVPDLRDVTTMVSMLDLLGARTTRDGDILTIDSTAANGIEAPYDLVRTMRASIYVLAPTLAVHGRARVSMPGGCAWGPRPIDLHLMAMEKLGARIELEHGYIEARCERLRGGEVVFPISSVGATVQTIMAASLAEGTTVIENAALEPEIADLIHALQECGVEIEGTDTPRVVVHGTTSVKPLVHRVIPDRIEAETFAGAAAVTGGDVTITNCNPAHMGSVLSVLEACGCRVETQEGRVRVIGPRRLKATDVVTREYPGFPTDMQAQIIAVLCCANGVSTVKETIYPDRFTHVPELRRFGADIRLDGNLAVIRGAEKLEGAPVMATDIRASSGLILAAMAARGRSEILRVYHIDRGYQKIELKLRALGANIERATQ
jgi:UDP-N-acetylglucosamine 1-carboxyvinyltransferase